MGLREKFANEIAENNSGYPKGMSDCYKFGMTWGCREDCPQLQRKKCEIYKSVEEYFEQENKSEEE